MMAHVYHRCTNGQADDVPPSPLTLNAAQVRALNNLVNDQELENLIVDEVVLHRIDLPDGSEHFEGTLHVRMTVQEPGEGDATRSAEWLVEGDGDVVAQT